MTYYPPIQVDNDKELNSLSKLLKQNGFIFIKGEEDWTPNITSDKYPLVIHRDDGSLTRSYLSDLNAPIDEEDIKNLQELISYEDYLQILKFNNSLGKN